MREIRNEGERAKGTGGETMISVHAASARHPTCQTGQQKRAGETTKDDLLLLLILHLGQPAFQQPVSEISDNAAAEGRDLGLRFLMLEHVTVGLCLGQVLDHPFPGFVLRQLSVREHKVQFLVERLTRAPVSAHTYLDATGTPTSYIISFSAVESTRRLFIRSHWRLDAPSSNRALS